MCFPVSEGNRFLQNYKPCSERRFYMLTYGYPIMRYKYHFFHFFHAVRNYLHYNLCNLTQGYLL